MFWYRRNEGILEARMSSDCAVKNAIAVMVLEHTLLSSAPPIVILSLY